MEVVYYLDDLNLYLDQSRMPHSNLKYRKTIDIGLIIRVCTVRKLQLETEKIMHFVQWQNISETIPFDYGDQKSST